MGRIDVPATMLLGGNCHGMSALSVMNVACLRRSELPLSHADFLTDARAAAQQIVESRSQNVFINYEEFTSGTTGNQKQCLRPSISWHLEFRRLRDLLDWAVEYHGIPEFQTETPPINPMQNNGAYK